MYLSEKYFKDLDFQYGDLMYLMKETGEGFTDTFNDGFSETSILFSNFSNGKIEARVLERLQQLEYYQ